MALVVVGQHIGHENVGQQVVVEIGNVAAHRKPGGVPQIPIGVFGERAVAVIDVDQVVVGKIIGHVDVRPAIPVQVGNGDAQPEALRGDAAGLAHFRKGIVAVVFEEFVIARRGTVQHLVFRVVGVFLFVEMVQQVHVQITVLIIIKKGGLGGKALVVKPVLLRLLGKPCFSVGLLARVDEKLVGRMLKAGMAEVDVRPAVLVHIGHAHARTPATRGNACLGGLVGKLEVALVQVQFAGCLVSRKKQVGESVVVEVGGCHATAVVEIIVFKDVVVEIRLEGVFKVNARLGGGYQFKKGIWLLACAVWAAGNEYGNQQCQALACLVWHGLVGIDRVQRYEKGFPMGKAFFGFNTVQPVRFIIHCFGWQGIPMRNGK